MDVFQYMPLELWKDMAERFLDPNSFGRLRQVNRAFRLLLGEQSKWKMGKRYTVTIVDEITITENFLNISYIRWKEGGDEWLKNGKRHRDGDLPAIINREGAMLWYKDGMKHRDDDRPAVIWVKEGPEWWVNDRRHRKDGPAVIGQNSQNLWYQNGLLHRDGGLPAVVRRNGIKFWYENGTLIK